MKTLWENILSCSANAFVIMLSLIKNIEYNKTN